MSDLPPSLRAELEAAPVLSKSWQDGVAPAFISLWLSVVFLNRLAPSTLLVGGLGPSAMGAVVAGLIGYWGLYYAPALWGAETRKPLSVISSSTFGAWGTRIIPGLLFGVVSIVLFAITVDAATEWSLSGLSALGMLDPKELMTSHRGTNVRPRATFLFVAGVWSIISAVIGTLAVRLVSAIMLVYPIFPAIVLGLALLWAMPTVGAGPVVAAPLGAGGWQAASSMAQMVFGFLAAIALMSADWGAASKTPRDARVGGLVGVMLAAPILATVSLLIVAGSLGRGIEAVSLREVFLKGIGGRLAGTGLLVLALALLGPACFTPFVIARQFSAIWPKVPRWAWPVGGAIATWPFILTGLSRRTDLMFGLLGAVAAPVAGAIAADYALRKGRWPGPRQGVNLAGMIAWGIGVGVGLLPYVGFPKIQPASILSFFAAFAAYAVLAIMKCEPRPLQTLHDEPAILDEPHKLAGQDS